MYVGIIFGERGASELAPSYYQQGVAQIWLCLLTIITNGSKVTYDTFPLDLVC